MIVKLLTEHHLEFLSLTGGCTGSSETTLVKMPHCWKSYALAHLFAVRNKKISLITHFHLEACMLISRCDFIQISWILCNMQSTMRIGILDLSM